MLNCGSKPLLCQKVLSSQTKTAVDAPSLVASFNLVHDHVLVNIGLNGTTNQTFMVDTGTITNVVDDDVAKQIGLHAIHPHDWYGIGLGEDKTTVSTLKDISLILAGTQIFHGSATALSLKSVRDAGMPISGILGLPFFKHFVVQIDYAHRILKLYDPNTYKYDGVGHIVGIHVQGVPVIQTEVAIPGGQPIEAKLEIDTGNDDVILLNKPFQMKHTLPWPGEVTVPAYGVGIGGDYEQRLGRLEALEIGDLRIAKPLVNFPEVQRGMAATNKFDGSVGGKLLERFTVIFNYSRKEMILEPNLQFGEPFKANVSGVWFTDLVREGNHVATSRMNMSQDSPLAQAGFRQDDKLVAINGKLTTDYSQDEIESLFSEEGKIITLTVERSGKPVKITFTLPRLL